MSALTVGVNSSETLWTVDAVPDPEFGFYTVGSEIVQVIAGFPGGDPGYAVGQTFPSKIRVVRGTNDTTAASHLSGAALTAANAFSGGGGAVPDPSGAPDGQFIQTFNDAYTLGVGAQVSLLGPFTFNKDSVLDVDGSYHTLAGLDEGVIVMRAWAVFSESFTKAAAIVDVGVAIGNAGGTVSADVVNYPFTTSMQSPESAQFTNQFFDSEPVVDPATDIVIGPIFAIKVGAILTAYTSDIPCDTGACSVYVLLATPAV